ncbi:family 2 glycosyl transferase [Azoarcus sp. CIB]|uniref:glycosyltransferase n=1 Tax=Aromatoleum sp. (strain CIB) TaxID=198107 RepID=UPI00067D4DB1|nr:glycosyltransferase [Azoarcus sp. CIB]AKU11737.1 family 2 glycosyl transferase [Azoarcus sp. CIB]
MADSRTGCGDEVTLTIAIKTYNEEQKIGACIESAIQAGNEAGVTYEIIVADSLSSDATVDIASRYPVRVVRMRNPADRGCGAGVQLSYQHAKGAYIFFVDGDMTIEKGFLPSALAALRGDARLAGVAGILTDTRLRNGIDRIRRKNRLSSRAGFANWLNGGGVYKRRAIVEAGGYAADRNLLAYEEAELGMRLRAAGWRLLRIDVPAVQHTGHDVDAWTLLAHQWRSGRAMASGVFVRGALFRPWRWQAVNLFARPCATAAYWLIVVIAAAVASDELRLKLLGIWLLAGLSMCMGLLALKRDLRHVALSLYHWHYVIAAIARGIFHPRHDPLLPLESTVLREPFAAGMEAS